MKTLYSKDGITIKGVELLGVGVMLIYKEKKIHFGKFLMGTHIVGCKKLGYRLVNLRFKNA